MAYFKYRSKILINNNDQFNRVIAYVESLGYVPCRSYLDRIYTTAITAVHLYEDSEYCVTETVSDDYNEVFLPEEFSLTPRSHFAGRIAHANGHTIEIRVSGDVWEIDDDPRWCEGNEYRVYVPTTERVFPVTSVTGRELYEMYIRDSGDECDSFVKIVNAAIKQHILDQEKENA